MADAPTPEDSGEELALNANEFADVYEIDKERAITEAKLQRWYNAMESEHAS